MRSELTRAVCALGTSKRDKDRSATPMLLCSCVCRLLVLLGALVFISDSLNERSLGPGPESRAEAGHSSADSRQLTAQRSPVREERKQEETERARDLDLALGVQEGTTHNRGTRGIPGIGVKPEGRTGGSSGGVRHISSSTTNLRARSSSLERPFDACSGAVCS